MDLVKKLVLGLGGSILAYYFFWNLILLTSDPYRLAFLKYFFYASIFSFLTFSFFLKSKAEGKRLLERETVIDYVYLILFWFGISFLMEFHVLMDSLKI